MSDAQEYIVIVTGQDGVDRFVEMGLFLGKNRKFAKRFDAHYIAQEAADQFVAKGSKAARVEAA